jgi:outer membrane protein TolC
MLVPGCALALAGCSTAHYRRSADKEAYQAIAQKTPAVTNMEPHFTIEQTNALALDDLPVAAQTNDFLGQTAEAERGARVLSLEKVLEIAVHHSRSYQTSKEQLYLAALSLTLSRHQFAPIFSGSGQGTYAVQTGPAASFGTNAVSDQLAETHSFHGSGSVSVDWLIRDLGRISAAFTTDFLRFISGNPSTLTSSQIGATFSRPLLRNAGFKAEIENLTQAERSLLYQLRDFTRFRKDFSVQIASAYYNVLGNRDAARNSFLNLQSSHRSAERTRALAAEGRATQTDLGRLEQQELSAESSWIGAVRTYQRALDDFKIQLGIPMETKIVLDDRELEQLQIHHPEINVEDSIKVALAARLDYQNLRDQQEDNVRKVRLAADRLKPQLDFTANAGIVSPQQDHGFAVPELQRYNWNAGLNLDLPLERKSERNSYRSALISQAQSARALDQLGDQIELQIRDSWRTLEQDKRTYEINVLGVKLAERRVEEQDLRAEFGRANALDQVDAQNALNSSKDQRTQALVAHTIARLQFWNNMGILYIKDNGQWEEVNSTNANNE